MTKHMLEPASSGIPDVLDQLPATATADRSYTTSVR
jgi:hypothetical protein